MFDGLPPARTLRDYPSDEIGRLGATVDRADAYVLLTAEYNHGYPAVLKNAMDHTFVEWRHKPVSFVGWGNVGGARAIEQLRLVAVEFEMAPLRHAVHVLPDVMAPARAAEDPADVSMFSGLQPRLDRLVHDLSWWSHALRPPGTRCPPRVPGWTGSSRSSPSPSPTLTPRATSTSTGSASPSTSTTSTARSACCR